MTQPTPLAHDVQDVQDVQDDLARRFSGMDRLYGTAAAQRIRAAHIAVVGIGGVGSWTAEALARSGVGRISLIDMDHIAESNINRQIHALTPTIGQAKVLAMQERIALINPACEVLCVDAFVEPDNWPALLPEGVDGVVDACDQVRAKTAMAQWALRARVAFVTVGAAGGKTQAHRVAVDDLAFTTHDPLLAKVRYQLRKLHRDTQAKAQLNDSKKSKGKSSIAKLGIHCVYSQEPVAGTSAAGARSDNTLNCHGYGSSVTVTATFGLCAAGVMIEKISKV